MAQVVIRLTGVDFERGERRILHAIDWEVARGQHWALVGTNGSGKSTLLNIVAGYLWASRGTVDVLGQRLGRVDVRVLRQSIGWVGVGLTEWFGTHHRRDRVRDVVASGAFASIGLYREVPDSTRAEAQALMRRFGVEELADEPFGVLSQGEKQRVILSRAWMAHPLLLILDEPASGLDVVARERLLATVAEMGADASGPTLIYVTHHVEEVLPVFTHTLLLGRGEVAARGTTTEVLTSERLSSAFGVALEVVWRARRPWVILGAGG